MKIRVAICSKKGQAKLVFTEDGLTMGKIEKKTLENTVFNEE